jgi:hypothetical protein
MKVQINNEWVTVDKLVIKYNNDQGVPTRSFIKPEQVQNVSLNTYTLFEEKRSADVIEQIKKEIDRNSEELLKELEEYRQKAHESKDR